MENIKEILINVVKEILFSVKCNMIVSTINNITAQDHSIEFGYAIKDGRLTGEPNGKNIGYEKLFVLLKKLVDY